VALEAMACRVPVVATAVGGVPEVVVDGETGALVPPGDPVAMADRAIELLLDQTRWRRTREAAIERSRAFAAERIVPQYEAVYRRVIEG
jgi:glycosyltransferase involved in cell wall biosynthesis